MLQRHPLLAVNLRGICADQHQNKNSFSYNSARDAGLDGGQYGK